MPQGMVKLSPDNEEQGWKAGYEYDVLNIAGFSHIHSWVMGGILTMPTTGDLQILPGYENDPDAGYRSRFRHETENASPGYYAVTLDDYGIRAELTTTTRVGIQRYTFPEAAEARILVDLKTPTEYGYILRDAVVRRVSESEIEGVSMQFTHDEFTGFDNDYTVHFVMRTSRPFTGMGGWVNGEVTSDAEQIAGHGDVGVFLNYQTGEGDVIVVQTGVSLVSVEQARLNLDMETEPFGMDFDAAREQNRSTWNELLSRIELDGGTEANRRKFYTNMYRAFAARTTWSDANGKWVDQCEQVQQLEDPESPMLGADAFWNSFWNLNLLWTLVTPEIAEQWVRSFLAMYDVGGWLPKGPTGLEYSSIMVASHEIPLMVSAYQKGIRGYDVGKAYEAMKHNQSVQGQWHECGGFVGNRNLASYMKYGYVAHGDSMGWKIWGTPWEGSGSNTLEYSYDDWTVAQMANALGHDDDYREFTRRAGFYRNQWDDAVAYMRPRYADGSWAWFAPIGKIDQREDWYGTGYVEGNAWLFSWFAPQDVAGLIKLYGGAEPFNRRLLAGFEASRAHDFGTVDGLFVRGYVNHGNQPNMQAAYLFNYSGMPWETQRWARAIMDQFYGEGPTDGWPGDEDQGQMGAWFVNSALGLFEMKGGAAVDPVVELGSPLFDRATIHLDERYYPGGTFVIEAQNVSQENKFIQSATLDGEPLSRPWFYFREITDGGSLVLVMGPEPNKDWGGRPQDAPPSMSTMRDSDP
jgi:predicted alpha-1,2-mannosidase